MALPRLERFLNTILLVTFISTLLPIITVLLWLNYAAAVASEQRFRLIRRGRQRTKKTILITGASTAHGLNVAQGFYKDGHRVVSAGCRSNPFLSIAKRSRAISKHYDIPNLSQNPDVSYFGRCLLAIAKQESPDLWIDCSQDIDLDALASAQQQIQEGTSCICFAPDHDSVQHLSTREALLDFLRNKRLPAPELYTVRTRGEIHNILNRSQGKKQFFLKSAEKQQNSERPAMLPRRTLSQTYQEVSLVKITPGGQLILEEYVDASNTYQCSAIVVRGSIRLFSAKQQTGDLNISFSDKSALWKAFRAYTDAITREFGSSFTSHLMLTFLLNEKITSAGVEQQILPIEGKLRFDPMFVFPRVVGSVNDLVQAYSCALTRHENGTSNSSSSRVDRADSTSDSIAMPIGRRQRYFLSTSVDELAVRPCTQLLLRKTSLPQVAGSILTLSYRLLSWDEAYYEFYDPLPAFWQCTIIPAWAAIFGAG